MSWRSTNSVATAKVSLLLSNAAWANDSKYVSSKASARDLEESHNLRLILTYQKPTRIRNGRLGVRKMVISRFNSYLTAIRNCAQYVIDEFSQV